MRVDSIIKADVADATTTTIVIVVVVDAAMVAVVVVMVMDSALHGDNKVCGVCL